MPRQALASARAPGPVRRYLTDLLAEGERIRATLAALGPATPDAAGSSAGGLADLLRTAAAVLGDLALALNGRSEKFARLLAGSPGHCGRSGGRRPAAAQVVAQRRRGRARRVQDAGERDRRAGGFRQYRSRHPARWPGRLARPQAGAAVTGAGQPARFPGPERRTRTRAPGKAVRRPRTAPGPRSRARTHAGPASACGRVTGT